MIQQHENKQLQHNSTLHYAKSRKSISIYEEVVLCLIAAQIGIDPEVESGSTPEDNTGQSGLGQEYYDQLGRQIDWSHSVEAEKEFGVKRDPITND